MKPVAAVLAGAAMAGALAGAASAQEGPTRAWTHLDGTCTKKAGAVEEALKAAGLFTAEGKDAAAGVQLQTVEINAGQALIAECHWVLPPVTTTRYIDQATMCAHAKAAGQPDQIKKSCDLANWKPEE